MINFINGTTLKLALFALAVLGIFLFVYFVRQDARQDIEQKFEVEELQDYKDTRQRVEDAVNENRSNSDGATGSLERLRSRQSRQ